MSSADLVALLLYKATRFRLVICSKDKLYDGQMELLVYRVGGSG
jgi:hypothetical protein